MSGARMEGDEYAAAIKKLGMTQGRASTLFDASARAGRYWVKSGPPTTVAVIIRLMLELGLTAADIERYKAGGTS